MLTFEEQYEAMIERVVRRVVREEIERQMDEPVSKKYIAELYGVTLTTVMNWERTGKIKRINPPGGHGRYSRNEVMNLKNK